jgi:hypothetical protein
VAVVLSCAIALSLAVLLLWNPGEMRAPNKKEPSTRAERRPGTGSANLRSATSGELAANEKWVGGIKRPITDVAEKQGMDGSDLTSGKQEKSVDPLDYGQTPPVAEDANVHVRSAVEAIRNKSNPERLSVLLHGAPFDLEAYRTDPESYLNVVEPGRVFAPAQPGPDVPRISRIGPYFQKINQNEEVELAVQAVPQTPVTFTSMDLGRFVANSLTTITVEADNEGIARAVFTAPPGTASDTNILAASPVTSGQVKFVVNTRLPNAVDDQQ